MICKLGGFITQRHSELRELEAEFLSMVCSDVEIEAVLQDISGEHLNRGSNKAQDARLDIHAQRHRSAFFDVRVCNPNAVWDLEPQQIYRIHENEKKRLYSKRVLDIEHGTFTPLVFTTTGGMGKECLMYHSRLAQLIAIKKGEQHDTIRDLLTSHISKVCRNVETEPLLQPLNNEVFNLHCVSREARLDMKGRGFWTPGVTAFFDVRVTHVNSRSNQGKYTATIFREQENEKKRKYNQRVMDLS
ncbi:unnamed protein product [Porites lobata]|uniref:Uncharacterized protein n=1 Tax=Porites lobata TaxID=104759 RepID=A0ABN8NC94_9CNID|nr:unnamed protein product [Porites lobata]